MDEFHPAERHRTAPKPHVRETKVFVHSCSVRELVSHLPDSTGCSNFDHCHSCISRTRISRFPAIPGGRFKPFSNDFETVLNHGGKLIDEK